MQQNDKGAQAETLLAALAAIPGSAPPERRADGWWISAPALDVEAMARTMQACGGRLMTVTGLARQDGETTLIYHFAWHRDTINFRTGTRSGAIPSLAPILRPAAWIEREIHDFFAVNFVGHPNLVPLLRPKELKEGFFREPELRPAR